MGAPLKIPAPNWVDKVVGFVNPTAGLERLRARTQMAIAGQWFGARFDRRATSNWTPYGGSADADIVTDLRWLRNRSRDLVKNSPLALGAVNTVVTSAVGSGLSMRSAIDAATLDLTQDQAQEWQRTTERKFRLWANDPNSCDATRTQNFYQLQALAFRSAFESGDVFASLPMLNYRGATYKTKINMIEADRVVNKGYAANSERLSLGVQTDENGAPVAYHILRHHPGGLMPMQMEWDVVPAFGSRTGRRNIVHLFDRRRPGQTRGIPYIAPVIELIKQLGDYTTAEVTAAVISGMFTVFVTSDGGGMGGLNTGPADNPPAAQAAGGTLQMAPGAILDLNPGEKVEFANPNRPSTAFDPFVQAVLRQIGVALELPFEILIKHFTASYSAARAAMIEAWRFYKSRRDWMAAQFCQPIYEAWLEEAIAMGDIEAPGFFDSSIIRAAYVGTRWVGDAPGQLDPQKEVAAAKGRIELNVSTYDKETAELCGDDWDALIERRAREEARMRDLGVTTVFAPLTPANVNSPVPNNATPENEPDEQGDTEKS